MGIRTGVKKWDMKTGRQIMNENVEVGAPHCEFCVKIAQEDERGR
jgi:hypothetical protein